MSLLAKKILRDPLRRLTLGEASRRVATANPETNRNGESTQSFPLQTKMTTKVATIKKEQLSIPTELRSYCPEGRYWKVDHSGQKRKRKTTVRLIESVQMGLPLKIERRNEDIRSGLHKRAKTISPTIDTQTMDGNKAGLFGNGVKNEDSKKRSKKQHNGSALKDSTKHNARSKWAWETGAPNGTKTVQKPLEALNPSSHHRPKPAPVAGATKTSTRANVHTQPKKKKKKKEKEKKKKKKKEKKKKKVPTTPQQSQEQPGTSSRSQEVCTPEEKREFFLAATQAAKDFLATEEGARYRTNNDEDSLVVLV